MLVLSIIELKNARWNIEILFNDLCVIIAFNIYINT